MQQGSAEEEEAGESRGPVRRSAPNQGTCREQERREGQDFESRQRPEAEGTEPRDQQRRKAQRRCDTASLFRPPPDRQEDGAACESGRLRCQYGVKVQLDPVLAA